MKTIKLHGALGQKFGEEWVLDVTTPGEALRAIDTNKGGLIAHLMESEKQGIGYRVVTGEIDRTAEGLAEPFGREILHIVPVMAGAKDGFGNIIIGAAMIAAVAMSGGTALAPMMAAGVGSTTIGAIAMNIGISLALGGVAQMLAGSPQAPEGGFNPADQKSSYYFNGPVTNMRQGGCVPVGYGRLIVGMTPISSGLAAENVI